jgi:hypothetical protein
MFVSLMTEMSAVTTAAGYCVDKINRFEQQISQYIVRSDYDTLAYFRSNPNQFTASS